MNSISVKDFEATLDKFIGEYDLPWEVKRLVIKEVYEKASAQANAEMIQQAQEREAKKE